ncbi:Uncharacterised protein [Serratia liquefaciens]|nr:Uncharacterised protein [Serratia quinivorans]CAI1086090.1 Uncharacterised protein [Serratia quinivorans]CAI2122397.1 Uncharacterised protein [Serratia quinivorans]CAI2489469.1 Uncharacterised protein [Serratia liquefaciens]
MPDKASQRCIGDMPINLPPELCFNDVAVIPLNIGSEYKREIPCQDVFLQVSDRCGHTTMTFVMRAFFMHREFSLYIQRNVFQYQGISC